ncbi:hypothetical protein ACFFF5_18150 [Lederbergia wuyishanensis]|uniref:DUF5668 domain-containing protein n=1 Tax=Lederbergia wuyishanensis TaxID=1347903 RepID=A0ABU0D4N8_9BACI|nr:hypothetical protein [Lederbergia wuyishanensis]MCJ8008050.1 hypothetical protein [Lederbergia wuyishanensis]MDQ0343365.1 hypothetical protein [Lederbergia wuyishanensis]
MRTWRVGSFSMGGALVFLGVFLLLQQVLDWDPAVALLSWWPVLFIILGIEILIYLSFFNKENSHVKYDFISIIFIGFIGTLGLGVALLQSVGLLDAANQYISAEVKTVDLPKYEETMLDGITRVQVDAGSYPVTIESTTSKTMTMFGTYRGDVYKKGFPVKEVSDYALVEKLGDTIYIRFKDIPYKRYSGFSGHMEPTLLIPENMNLEVNGKGNSLALKPRNMKNDWEVVNGGYLDIMVSKDTNVKLDVQDSRNLDDGKWENMKKVQNDYEDVVKSANQTFGTGKHTIFIKNADGVNIK